MKISSYRDNATQCNNFTGSHVGITKAGITKLVVSPDNVKRFSIVIQPEDFKHIRRLMEQYEEAEKAGRLK